MRWQALLGLALLGASSWVWLDLKKDQDHAWPAYAEPQASCGTDLSGIHDGIALRFRFPSGWSVAEKQDARSGIVESFLTASGGPETTLFLREATSRASMVTVPAAEPAKMRDALNDAAASQAPAAAAPPAALPSAQPPGAAEASGAVRLADTDQALTFDEKRHGNAYLTRLDEGSRVSFSWMAFVWDTEGRMTAVSGPKLVHSNWPGARRRAREVNCAFWEVLRTIEPK